MRLAWPLAALVLAACGDASDETESLPTAPPPSCAEGEYTLPDGRCIRVGVPENGCAAGFVHHDAGCEPTLPAESCPPGQLAIPGDTACHEPAPCGDGRWGDIPAGATTIFVDASYANADSDGSAMRPFRAIQPAIDAAPSGGVIAIAAGKYAENVEVSGKPVILWGRCPSLVSLAGVDGSPTVAVIGGASGTTLRALAVTGLGPGVVVSGAESVVLEGAWVHGTSSVGVQGEETFGATSIDIIDSLVESSTRRGVAAVGARVHIEASLVRDVQLQGPGTGSGVLAIADIAVSQVTLMQSVVERTHEVAVGAQGSELDVEGTVVRDTAVGFDQPHARGIEAHSDRTRRSVVTVRASVVERNSDAGIIALGADATIENTVARDTAPSATGSRGAGISIENDFIFGPRSNAVIRASLLQGNHSGGLLLIGSDLTVEDSLVRGTLVAPRGGGRGAQIEEDPDAGQLAVATLRRVVSEDNIEVGVFAIGADVTIEDSVIARTAARGDGLFGDGAVAVSLVSPTNLAIKGSLIERHARVGIGSWGAHVSLERTVAHCNSIDLNGEPYQSVPYQFENLGNNLCGCDSAAECQVLTSGVAAPPQLE